MWAASRRTTCLGSFTLRPQRSNGSNINTKKINATDHRPWGLRNRLRIRRQLLLVTSSFSSNRTGAEWRMPAWEKTALSAGPIEIGCSPGSSSTCLLPSSKERLCRRKESMEALFHETHVLVCGPIRPHTNCFFFDACVNRWRTGLPLNSSELNVCIHVWVFQWEA